MTNTPDTPARTAVDDDPADLAARQREALARLARAAAANPFVRRRAEETQ